MDDDDDHAGDGDGADGGADDGAGDGDDGLIKRKACVLKAFRA